MIPTISQAQSREDIAGVRQLLIEYLTWIAGRAKDVYGEDIDVNELADFAMSETDHFLPPNGRLLLAREGGNVAGMACMKKAREGTGEIRRMYVSPAYRRKNIGRQMVEQLIQSAREIGYSKILLDTPDFMNEAQSLYRAVGFREVERDPETKLNKFFQDHLVFMELELG